ncbi:MAG: tetratricopeptide repeat protein [Candidatus Omnitrophota bacterium]|jgi:tetratricopeptide (TPR) repeat protein
MDIKYVRILYILAIVVAGFAVYAGTLEHPFIWDDEMLITGNPFVKNWSHVPEIFSSDIGEGAGGMYHSFRPLQMLTYVADHSIWRSDTTGYHLTNIFLHILTALAIFWLVSILFENMKLAFFAAFLFVIHPVHTEAVTYISGRSDPLSALFFVLAFICYIKRLDGRNIAFSIMMSVCYCLALLARESAIILPIILILYHYTFGKTFSIKKFIPVLAITAIYVILRFTLLERLLLHTVVTTDIMQRLPGFFAAMFEYTRLLLAPSMLHMEYGLKIFRAADARVIAGFLIASGLLIVAFRNRKSNRLIFFAVMWFFLTLIPVSNLYPVNAYMAEHWLYLPSLGTFLVMGNMLRRLSSDKRRRILALALFLLLSGWYALTTVRQNSYWKDPVTFFERAAKYAPESHLIHNNLAGAYVAAGRKEDAIKEYEKAIAINPRYAKAYGNLGFLYAGAGKNKEAIEIYNTALKINPKDAVVLNNLGNAYYDLGSMKEAVDNYKMAVEADPNYSKAFYNLGNAYIAMGMKAESIISLKRAIELDGDYIDAYNNLGMVYKVTGDLDKAIGQFRKTIELDRNYVRGYRNLAEAYRAAGRTDEAEDVLKELERKVKK